MPENAKKQDNVLKDIDQNNHLRSKSNRRMYLFTT